MNSCPNSNRSRDLERGTTVSNAGRRKGRGKGAPKKIAKDLNKGQVIGIAKKNVIWPAINAPVFKEREVQRKQLASGALKRIT